MSKKYFKITPANRADIMPRLGEYIRSQDKPLRIKCEEDKETRSSQQNRRLHKIIGMCAKTSGYSIQEMKLTFKAELLEPLEIIKVKGFRVPIYPSTAAMSIAELNSFMTDMENLASLWYGVMLPSEGDCYG